MKKNQTGSGDTASSGDFRWRPIADYQVDPATLNRDELRSLAAVWQEQRDALEHSDGLRVFREKLCREWAVETGLIERLYTLDRGVTTMLIEQGIDAAFIPHTDGVQDPKQVAAMIRDHRSAVEGLFSFVRRERGLSVSYIKELHAQLTQNQATTTAVNGLGRRVEVAMVRGEFKQTANNPTRPDGGAHEYCPPVQVDSEMSRLIEMHENHPTTAPEVEAAWLHHRFTQIHPFQDGNGRVARCLATLIFLKAGWFPMVIRNSDRAHYITALESADQGALAPLVRMFAAAQRHALVKALGVADAVHKEQRVEAIIATLGTDLKKREQLKIQKWNQAKSIAARMNEIAYHRFEEVANELKKQTSGLVSESAFYVNTASGDDQKSYYFHQQIVETARHLDYYANTGAFRAWTHLVMRLDGQADILVSFHATGSTFRGLLAASACFFRRSATEEGERQPSTSTPLSDEVFQINYHEPAAAVEQRFRQWLEDILITGLQTWRADI